MSLWKLAWRYIWTRPLVTLLTLVGLALGAALISSVLSLRRETEHVFLAGSSTYDVVVGAKGSRLQLVMSSVYHLDLPNGNIPYERYEELLHDKRVRAAYPIGLGDNYEGFYIVGTVPDLMRAKRPCEPGETPADLFTLTAGRVFTDDFEVVVGDQVARQAGLAPGDTFFGSHGLAAAANLEVHKQFPYRVVGILAPSGTPDDRAIFTTLGSVWRIHEHEAEEEGKATEDHAAGRETTAVLVQLKMAGLRWQVADDIQRNTGAMAAIPMNEMFRLYQQILGPAQRMLMATAYLVVTVAALSILTTLYQSAERRRRDLAVLRSLGAHPGEIFALVLSEAVLLTVMGVLAGWLAGHAGAYIAGIYLQHHMGLAISPWTSDRTEVHALAAVAVIGFLAGLVPATISYRRSPVSDLSAA